MPNTFSKELKKWRGNRYRKDAAWTLGITYPLYRLYECGKRTPCKLAMCELQRRMEEHPDAVKGDRRILNTPQIVPSAQSKFAKAIQDLNDLGRLNRIAARLQPMGNSPQLRA